METLQVTTQQALDLCAIVTKMSKLLNIVPCRSADKASTLYTRMARITINKHVDEQGVAEALVAQMNKQKWQSDVPVWSGVIREDTTYTAMGWWTYMMDVAHDPMGIAKRDLVDGYHDVV